MKKWMLIMGMFLFLAAILGPGASFDSQAHGTSEKTVTKKMLRDTPPASYRIDMGLQRNPKDGEYGCLFPEDEIQTVKIEIDENNLNYLLQNADKKPSVMTNSVHIGDESIGYAGLKTKGSYTLEHTYNDHIFSDRFSFTVNFGKYIKEEQYGENQNFYGCKKISFNNFYFDKSMMREFFSLKLLNEMGLPAPKYVLAKLYINDAYYGVYFMVEGLDQALLARHQKIKRKEVGEYITKPENTTLAYDKRLDRFWHEDGFDLHTVLKKDEKGIYHASGILGDSSFLWEEDEETLQDVAETLPTVLSWQKKLNQLSDGLSFDGKKLDVNSGEYIAALNEIMDVDEVVRYFAAHSFLVQLDNMFVEQHNYGLYIDDNGKASILPWDYDLSFGCYYPSTSEFTANFDLDMMYKGGDSPFFSSTPLSPEEIYAQFPLFHVIYQNASLMEKYHTYMRDCTNIAALGGTTSFGKKYEPSYFFHYIEVFGPSLMEAASEQLADNVTYLNHTTQPDDLTMALPNLANIIAMRALGVRCQTDKMDMKVSGEGCDLSTLGNAIMGENSKGGKLAAIHAQTSIFVTADYGEEKWSNPSPFLEIEGLDKKEKVFQTLLKEIGCDEEDLTVYTMSNPAKPIKEYGLHIPMGSGSDGKEVSIYSYDEESETATELSVAVKDSIYSTNTTSIQYIAIVQKVSEREGYVKLFVVFAGILLVLTLAGAGVWLLRSGKHEK